MPTYDRWSTSERHTVSIRSPERKREMRWPRRTLRSDLRILLQMLIAVAYTDDRRLRRRHAQVDEGGNSPPNVIAIVMDRQVDNFVSEDKTREKERDCEQ